MKAKLRRMCVLILLALTAGMVAACGGGTSGTEPGGGAAATSAPGGGGETTAAPVGDGAAVTSAPAGGSAATAAPAGGASGSGVTLPAECTNVDLQFWNPFTGPDGPFMGQLVEQFNTANPNIKATMTTQAEYYTQLGTAQASNTLPDVAIVHADQVATQAFRNVIRPIDDLVQQIGVKGDDFPAPVWNAGEVAGKRYSIPLDIHPAVLFYNEDLLKAAGINAPPKTRTEFEAAAAATTNDTTRGFLLTTGFFSRQIFEMLLNQFGGSAFNQDGTQVTWNSDAGVQAMQLMKDYQTKYSEPNLETDAEVNGLKAGTAAMMLNGIWQTSNVTGEAVDFAGKGTAVPQFGDQPAVWAGSHQLALPIHQNADTCKDAAAGVFIKYLVDNSIQWARAGQIPASNSVRNSTEFKAIEPQASIAPSVENAFFPPSVPGITDAYAALDEAVSSLMSGTQTDIKATLDDAANRANAILAQNKQTYGDAPKSQ